MFSITAEDKEARTGLLKTAQGKIETPCFLQVATKGTPKLITTGMLSEMGGQALICNSLLLYLKPGMPVIHTVGNIHSFFGWKKPIFTDSGGFQSIAPSLFLGITKEGLQFKNPFTLKKVFLTPQRSIQIQNALGGEAAYCLDYMPPTSANTQTLEESVSLTTRWAEICRKEHTNKNQLLTGICQGGVNKKLRKQSTREITELGFDIMAIGGLGIGETKHEREETIQTTKKIIPPKEPVHLMGIGSPGDIITAISKGVDLFDSCYPTRMARHGAFFCGTKTRDITKKEFEKSREPPDKNCTCYTCTNHSTALIHHLFRVKEQNAQVLLSIHNVHFILNLMKEARKAISLGKFKKFQNAWN